MHEPLIVRIAPRDRYRKAASNAAVPPPMDLVPLRRTARTGTNKAYSHFHPPATVVPEEEPQHHEVEYLSDQDGQFVWFFFQLRRRDLAFSRYTTLG